jgi:hypothetical protein|tara:strand:+ start:257 stop:574 length:318 start_codon:yes stop_codon:yes gene_type:complete
MTYYIQIGTTNYNDDILLLRKAIGKLESECQVTDGYLLGEPMSKFGWTFFDLILKPNLHLSIEDEFADLLKKSKGSKPQEKFINFLSKFFESNDCNVKLKLIEMN